VSPPPETELKSLPWRKLWPWLNGAITLALLGGGIWYLSHTIDFSDIKTALLAADGRFILLGLLIFILNGSIKAWRWQVLLAPDKEEPVSYTAVFWAIWLGQFVNTILPFLRLGEIGRAYAINQQTSYSKAQAVSTMLIEKSLELFLLGLILLLLIPLSVLPPNFDQLGIVLAFTATILLLGMGLLVYKTNQIVTQLQRLFRHLPAKIELWLHHSLISGLKGLSALRMGTSISAMVLLSLLITLLDILIPYVLFFAFALPLSFSTAILINIAIALVTTPPTAPGELGIFEAAVFFVLAQVGQAEVLGTAVIFSYALVFHLCTLLPKIIFGSLAAMQTKWSWQHLNTPTAS
jgi:uncharacterized protein (TIRG00374 family)